MTLRALALDVMISLVLVGGAVAAEPPRADLPTYALGEKWIRSDGLYELVRVEDGLYVFTSGQGRERTSEVSIELPELGHGIFTYYLVNGLKGAADLNRDGIISLQELYEYVEQQVSAKSRAVGGNQHPVMKGELEGVLPLAKVGGK